MTENNNASVSAPQNQGNATEASSLNSPAQQPAEKLLRQSEVNELVGSVKHSSYEKGKQDALAEWQKQQSATQQNSTVNNSVNTGLTQATLTAEQRDALKKEVTGEIQQQMQTDQLVNQFALKMNAGMQKHTDFEKTVTSLQLQNIPHLVRLANGFENTADIMYDLGKNPSKISNLTVLAQLNPQLAYEEMQRLSDSIKKNETAVANQQNVREPLSQIKSSNVGSGNGGKLSVSELRKNPLYRA
jgi:hypothetical protein